MSAWTLENLKCSWYSDSDRVQNELAGIFSPRKSKKREDRNWLGKKCDFSWLFNLKCTESRQNKVFIKGKVRIKTFGNGFNYNPGNFSRKGHSAIYLVSHFFVHALLLFGGLYSLHYAWSGKCKKKTCTWSLMSKEELRFMCNQCKGTSALKSKFGKPENRSRTKFGPQTWVFHSLLIWGCLPPSFA